MYILLIDNVYNDDNKNNPAKDDKENLNILLVSYTSDLSLIYINLVHSSTFKMYNDVVYSHLDEDW